MAAACEKESPFNKGEIEMDESYYKPSFVCMSFLPSHSFCFFIIFPHIVFLYIQNIF